MSSSVTQMSSENHGLSSMKHQQSSIGISFDSLVSEVRKMKGVDVLGSSVKHTDKIPGILCTEGQVIVFPVQRFKASSE